MTKCRPTMRWSGPRPFERVRRHAVRVEQLSEHEWIDFCADLFNAEGAVARVSKPDHMNPASMGNVIPHLHWHIVPRYRNDPRWGSRFGRPHWLLCRIRDPVGVSRQS